VRLGTAVTPPGLAHHARYEPPVLTAPLVARCGFMFAPEDSPGRPARPYSRCPHCEHLAEVAEARPDEYAAYSAGYRAARLADWKTARRADEAET
jgi:hypothetical protein